MASEAELEAAYREACDCNDDQAALAAAAQLVQEYPDSSWHWFWYAVRLLDLDRFPDVERALDQAEKHNPEPQCECCIFICWGRLRSSLGQYALAEQAFQNALPYACDDGHRSMAWFFTGFVQRRLDRLVDAERSFSKALELRPDYDEAMFNLAMCVEEMGVSDPAQTIALLRRAIEIDPAYMVAIRELGRLLWSRGDAEEGERLLRKSLELCPQDERTYECLAEGLGREGRASEVIDVWKAAAAALPAWPRPGIELCVVYLTLEKHELAEDILRQALRLESAEKELAWVGKRLLDDKEPAEPLASLAIRCGLSPEAQSEMRLVRARALNKLGRQEEAVAAIERLVEDNPDDSRFLAWAGSIVSDSDFDRAIVHLRRAVEIDPSNSFALRELGVALYFGTRQYKEAEQWLRTALGLSPGDDWARYVLAGALQSQGDDRQAEAEFLRVTATSPRWSPSNRVLGGIYQSRGDYQEAETRFRMAVEIDPEDADALAALGLFLADMDRNDEARPLLRRSLCLNPNLDEADKIRDWLSLHGE